MSVEKDLAPDVWRIVANRCVGVHHWYCVYEVAHDLAALQQVCRSSTECASDAWPLLAKYCDPKCADAPEKATVKDPKRILRNTPRELLEQAAKLKPDQLTVFRQIQLYKTCWMYGKEACSTYRLTVRDLALLKHRLVQNPNGRGFAPARQYSKQVGNKFAGVVWFTCLKVFISIHSIFAGPCSSCQPKMAHSRSLHKTQQHPDGSKAQSGDQSTSTVPWSTLIRNAGSSMYQEKHVVHHLSKACCKAACCIVCLPHLFYTMQSAGKLWRPA